MRQLDFRGRRIAGVDYLGLCRGERVYGSVAGVEREKGESELRVLGEWGGRGGGVMSDLCGLYTSPW